MKIFLDTNILVGFLTTKDENLKKEIKQLLMLIREGKIKPYISSTVLFEMSYILEKTFKVKKGQLIGALRTYKGMRNLTTVEKVSFTKALDIYEKTNVKLADIVIALQAPKDAVVCTFDKHFKKLDFVDAKTPAEIVKSFG